MQSTCSFLEAEAAVLALKVMGADTAYPSQDVEIVKDSSSGVRLAPVGTQQLQALVKTAVLFGMRKGHECKRSWAVINGAVHAWNAYLPILRSNRCFLFSSPAIFFVRPWC